MSDRDKGAVQRADSNSNRQDKGAVEKHVAASGVTLTSLLEGNMLVGGFQTMSGGV